ncbi:MAG: glucosaminidase domain-containing protein [Puniceicoccales bacterium]|nr:glucosaminidase domain-containing protein [Puniceicoccales bacterium]
MNRLILICVVFLCLLGCATCKNIVNKSNITASVNEKNNSRGAGSNFGSNRRSQLQRYSLAIMARGKASKSMMSRYLRNNNSKISKQKADHFASVYVAECEAEGINHDIAFAQMCHETNWLQFGGQVDPKQNNFAGLGATDDGAKGASFPSIEIGVRAQVQHLKAYASTGSLNRDCVDPRFTNVEKSSYRGSAKTLDDLTGKWATDPLYANNIKKKLRNMFVIK